MKRLLIVTMLVIGCLAVSAPSSAVTGRVHVSATLVDVRVSNVGSPGLSSGDTRSEVYRLWNRTVSDVPIGNGVVKCSYMGEGGSFGRGMFYCAGTYTLGSFGRFGKISVAGPRRRVAYANLVVTGGTGFYAGSGGSMHVRQGNRPGIISLTFKLVN